MNRVVRKPFNAKPGLEVNRSISLSCMKMFFTAYVLCGFRFFNSKLKDKQYTLKNLSKGYKTEIKIVVGQGHSQEKNFDGGKVLGKI